jgi:hypothetical protein
MLILWGCSTSTNLTPVLFDAPATRVSLYVDFPRVDGGAHSLADLAYLYDSIFYDLPSCLMSEVTRCYTNGMEENVRLSLVSDMVYAFLPPSTTIAMFGFVEEMSQLQSLQTKGELWWISSM